MGDQSNGMSPNHSQVDIFLQFFQGFQLETDAKPFYKGEIASMVARGATIVSFDYNHIKLHNPDAAYLLCRDPESSRKDILEAFKEFVPKDCDLHGKVTELRFNNFPWDLESSRGEKVHQFLRTNPPAEVFELLDLQPGVRGEAEAHELRSTIKAAVCSPAGMRVLQGFIDRLLQVHRGGSSWGGSFGASDLVIVTAKNGREEYLILKATSEAVDERCQTINKDFKQLASILLPMFKLGSSSTKPAFFESLASAMEEGAGATPSSSVDAMPKFTKFICRHMAFLPSLSRSNLICNLVRVYRVLDQLDKPKFENAVDTAKGYGDWVPIGSTYNLFRKVFHFQNKGKKPKAANKKAPYGETGMQLLLFQRNFVVHAVDHLKDKDANKTPLISTLEAVDYYLAHYFDGFLARVLDCLIRDLDLGELLEKVWENCIQVIKAESLAPGV